MISKDEHTEIEAVALTFLDKGIVAKGFSVTENTAPIQTSSVKFIGTLLIIREDIKTGYIVEYEQLVPLHGSGVDDINIVTDVKTMF